MKNKAEVQKKSESCSHYSFAKTYLMNLSSDKRTYMM